MRQGRVHVSSICRCDIAVHVGGREKVARAVIVYKQSLVAESYPNGRSMAPYFDSAFGVICARNILAAVYPPGLHNGRRVRPLQVFFHYNGKPIPSEVYTG